MIIETRGDVISVSGSLTSNHWRSISAAIDYLLQEYPFGVVINCSQLQTVTPQGIETFLEGIYNIEFLALPVVWAHLPPSVEEELERKTGRPLRRFLSSSIEDARMHQKINSAVWWERIMGQDTAG